MMRASLADNQIDALDRLTEGARTPKQIGATIRRMRRKRGLSQTKLGELTGLRQATISLIENGNPAATLETILYVLALLDLEFRISPRIKQGPDWVERIQWLADQPPLKGTRE